MVSLGSLEPGGLNAERVCWLSRDACPPTAVARWSFAGHLICVWRCDGNEPNLL
jgi:hypothetical protein